MSKDDANNQPPSADQDTENTYDPDVALKKAAHLQDKLMNAVDRMNPEDILHDKNLFENVNSLLNNVNSTSINVKRNNLIDTQNNAGAVADAVIEKMRENGIQMIRTADNTGRSGNIPNGIVIDDAEFEEITDGMLQRGLVGTNYDDFAGEHGLGGKDDE